jgi:hypothetical protein
MSRRVVIRPAIVYDAQGILKTHSAAVHRTASRQYASDILTAWAAPFDADNVRRMAGIIASQSEWLCHSNGRSSAYGVARPDPSGR